VPAIPATPRAGSRRSSVPRAGYAFGGYPDLDELFLKQASERDSKKREAILDQIQQATIDQAMFAPVMDLRALMGIGLRVTKHTITDLWMSPFPSYEDMEINGDQGVDRSLGIISSNGRFLIVIPGRGGDANPESMNAGPYAQFHSALPIAAERPIGS
jgi:hypothetical protein